jgi:hypothetical protein
VVTPPGTGPALTPADNAPAERLFQHPRSPDRLRRKGAQARAPVTSPALSRGRKPRRCGGAAQARGGRGPAPDF